MNWRRSLIFLLYRIAGWLLFPLLLLYFLRRVLRQREYWRHLGERFGRLPVHFRQTAHSSIWLHAVSVGEIASAAGLIAHLRKEFPLAGIFVSVTTVAGRRVAEQKLSTLTDGIFYAPIDYPFAIRSVLRELKPVAVIVLETEIWPNLYYEVKKTFAGLAILNGRISERAFLRYQKARWLFGEVLTLPDKILAQDAVSHARFAALLGEQESARRLAIGGNLKYDQDSAAQAAPAPVRGLLERAGARCVWVAASTMPPATEGDVDEDEAVIAAFLRLREIVPDLLLILVPRRPERFDEAAFRLERAGIRYLRRTALSAESTLALPGVLLLDSMGELASLFPLADVVFMGGTLARRGGHNILEPAQAGVPVIIGPHMENFPEIAADFQKADAVFTISSADHLADALRTLLADAGLRRELGQRGQRCAAAGKGAVARYAGVVADFYSGSVPRCPRSWWHYALLWPLTLLWRAGSAWKRNRQQATAGRLPAPVLSVGNLTTGGSGKTPAVIWLAERLRMAGRKPGILTRGYGRVSREPLLVFPPGAKPPRMETGDEAQMFLKRALAPVGIGADRYRAGCALADSHKVDVFLLDDGLQHWRLARDCNIVLVDALQPFGERDLVPLGRLREPLSALARADLFLLTRTESGARLGGIKRMLRERNSHAPIFSSRVKPLHWVNARSGEIVQLEALLGERVVAFCGLANPGSFWQTLRVAGLDVRARWRFGDHHAYAPAEMKRMGEQARALHATAIVTTEKDLQNFDSEWHVNLRDVPLYWLEIGMEIDDADGLFSALQRYLDQAALGRGTGAHTV